MHPTVVRFSFPSFTKKAASKVCGWRPAIAVSGNKWIHLVHFLEGDVVVSKLPAADERTLQPLTLKGAPYPVARAAKIFRRRKAHMTRAAKDIIEKALAG